MEYEVEGARERLQVQKDCQARKLNREDVMVHIVRDGVRGSGVIGDHDRCAGG